MYVCSASVSFGFSVAVIIAERVVFSTALLALQDGLPYQCVFIGVPNGSVTLVTT
jgi:hypothetical protein